MSKLLIAFATTCGILCAQTTPASRVDVRVRKSSGPLTQLTAKDFELVANGKPISIAACSFSRRPLDLIVVLDLSTLYNSADGERPLNTLNDNIRALPAQDRVGSVHLYKESVKKISDLTFDHRAVILSSDRNALLTGRNPDQSNRLLDALVTATQMYPSSKEHRRRVILVMSNDQEHGSGLTEDRVFARLQEAEIVVNEVVTNAIPPNRSGGMAIPIPRIGRGSKAGSSLRAICQATGGQLMIWRGASNIVEDVIEQSRSAYSISFDTPANGLRDLSIKLQPAARVLYPNAEVVYSQQPQ